MKSMANTFTYNHYGTYLRKKFEGKKVFKVIVDANFTCPNRDGSKGFGGCTYCNVDSFTPALARDNNSIAAQLNKSMERAIRFYKADAFIVYFQPNTNTYAPVAELQQLYDEALMVNPKQTVGLSIGTRADCLDAEKLDLIESYAAKGLAVDLEIGMESIYEDTLKQINRGCSHADLLQVMEMAKNRLFDMCVHTIFGLPGESQEMMLAVADEVNRLPIQFIKLHHLYIVKGSIMGVKYNREPFPLFSLDGYTDFLCDFIPRLRPDLVIQRLFGISDYAYHIAPNWGLDKRAIQDYMEKKFIERGVVQGSAYKPPKTA